MATLAGPVTPVGAQTVLEGITVTSANRTPTEAAKVGSTVEVLTAQDLQAQSKTYVKDYLDQLPGVSFVQNGPPGSSSTIRIRGAAGEYVKVLVDGIDISDPSLPKTSVTFENLLVGDVERIEVLKGSQSTLYGGNAVGGVISIQTKAAAKGASLSGFAEAGAYNTQNAAATAGYGATDGYVRFTVQGVRSDGFPALAGFSVDDGYRNLTVSGAGEYRVSPDVKVFFALRSLDADVKFAGSSDPVTFQTLDKADTQLTLWRAGRVGTEVKLFDGALVNTVAIQGFETKRTYTGDFPGFFAGDRTKAEYQGVAKLADQVSVLFGADWEENGARTNSLVSRRQIDITGAFAQASVEPTKNMTLTAGARNDSHSTFGDFATYRFTGAYVFGDWNTKIRSSYGTGFRTPSLSELFDPLYGTAGLKPEESRSFDVGIDQPVLGGKATLSATYFSLDTDNLIAFRCLNRACSSGGYFNISGTTAREGVELSARAQVSPTLGVLAAYTYTDARKDDGTRLVRVPRNAITLGADAVLFEKIKANVTAKIALDTTDTDFNLFPSRDVKLEDYVLLSAKLSYDLKPGVTAYVRGDNLLDQRYQTVVGYNTARLSVFGGVSFAIGEDEATAAPLK
jgi:vitamin B12 transporter